MRIHVITTGGSIDVEYSLQGTIVFGPPMVLPILDRARTRHEITVEALFSKDSGTLDDADRDLIRERARAASAEHILITHGTDSMTATAEHLRALSGKVIVVTGSIQPARMTDSDAAFNVGLAIGALQTLPHGVYIAMSGRIFRAGHVTKDRARGVFIDTDPG